MLLELKRRTLTRSTTLGDLLVDGKLECYTVEDVVRKDPNPSTPANEGKVMHETAIPAGTYEVIVNMSPKFKAMFPRLLNVPGFTGILIHNGLSSQDSSGCILVGSVLVGERIQSGTTKPAFIKLRNKIQAAIARGERVWITITDDFPQEPQP